MILNATLSKPCNNITDFLCKPYEKIKITIENAGGEISYFVQLFTKTQVFHEHWKENVLNDFLDENVGKTFKNCVKKTENEEITILTNKKGKQTEIRKKINAKGNVNSDFCSTLQFMPQKKKNYILQQGKPIPFLVMLGIMSGEGKVFNAKYDKFKQINKFLEFLDDAIDDVWGRCGGKNINKMPPPQERAADKTGAKEQPNGLRLSEDLGAKGKTFPSCIKICDFGCGKSYLTFAIHYFLTEIRQIPCEIEGLDLKVDVINYCNEAAQRLNLKGLHFKVGNISDYSDSDLDIVVTLHACDTATDFALKYAVEQGAKVILSVPCCQHEVNEQLSRKNKSDKKNSGDKKSFEKTDFDCIFDDDSEIFKPLLKWGIIREKFASLVTDSLRGIWLENHGYKVQMLEFTDESHTPKNILIRAVKKNLKNAAQEKKSNDKMPKIIKELDISPKIWN